MQPLARATVAAASLEPPLSDEASFPEAFTAYSKIQVAGDCIYHECVAFTINTLADGCRLSEINQLNPSKSIRAGMVGKARSSPYSFVTETPKNISFTSKIELSLRL
jgi:hypothetical protein